ncbi:hypothetical protein GH714_003938 [Hevea brasiliensis]|uniref:Uncharacterized protein n=1 Tax=Hevea brasiliensis TaxID=3981 RepID=A0A6A6LJM0_HEVBR|nr:hypothetical protein GH714_003938 [Hevea brasiliensis]
MAEACHARSPAIPLTVPWSLHLARTCANHLAGAGLSFLAGGVFGWTFGQEIANHWLQLYRLDTMAAQVKFMEWWEKKCEALKDKIAKVSMYTDVVAKGISCVWSSNHKLLVCACREVRRRWSAGLDSFNVTGDAGRTYETPFKLGWIWLQAGLSLAIWSQACSVTSELKETG